MHPEQVIQDIDLSQIYFHVSNPQLWKTEKRSVNNSDHPRTKRVLHHQNLKIRIVLTSISHPQSEISTQNVGV